MATSGWSYKFIDLYKSLLNTYIAMSNITFLSTTIMLNYFAFHSILYIEMHYQCFFKVEQSQ